MIAIIFEVQPAEGKRGLYLDYAARLKPELEKMDGFVSVERFESLTTPVFLDHEQGDVFDPLIRREAARARATLAAAADGLSVSALRAASMATWCSPRRSPDCASARSEGT